MVCRLQGRFFVYSSGIYLISCRSEMASVTKFYISVHAHRVAAWKMTVNNVCSHVNYIIIIIITCEQKEINV